jgi:hypothetical protein
MSNQKLPRVLQNIFGENAMEGNKIAQFGSVIAGNPLYTGDIEKIQALQEWQNGWVGATISDKRFPTSEETTGVNKVVTQQIAYLLQQGVPEWLDIEMYFDGCFCSRKGVIYRSVTDNNINNDPLTDSGENWETYKGASIDTNLEILLPYVERGVIGSSLQITNKTLAESSVPYINNGVAVENDVTGFSNDNWLMLAKTFPTNITHELRFIFYTTTPNLTQTIIGNSIENSIGIRDGKIALILDGIEYKGELELEANHRYAVKLTHSPTGYILAISENNIEPEYQTQVDIPVHFNVWSDKSIYLGLAGNNANTYLRGGIKADVRIGIEEENTEYYNMATATTEAIPYVVVNGSLVAWCPNGRNSSDSTLANSVNTFNGNNNTILTKSDKDLYFMTPNSQTITGKSYNQTTTPTDAQNGDVWYNSETNLQQVLSTINPNLFNRGCTIEDGKATGFSSTTFIELGGIFNLDSNWSFALHCDAVFGDDKYIGYVDGGKAFKLYTSNAVDHIAYGVQKESYSNVDNIVTAVGVTKVDENGNATPFAANSAGCVQINPTESYTGGLWNNIWALTPNSLVDDVILVGNNQVNGYMLKTNSLGQLFLSVTFNGATWGINSASSSTGILKADSKIYIKVEFTGNRYLVSTSTDKSAWSIVISVNNSSTMQAANPVTLGGGGITAFDGVFHLRECSIYAINKIVWTGNLITSGFVKDSGINNTYVPVSTQIYKDADFATELAVATGNDFKYVAANNQTIYSTTKKVIMAALYREDVQKVYKQTQSRTSYQVAYEGVIGYVDIEGLIGTFVPDGQNIYSSAQLDSVIDIANGSNYIFTGVKDPIYVYTYGYSRIAGEEGQYVNSGTLIYSDVDTIKTIEAASGTDYIYLEEFSKSLMFRLTIPQGDTQTGKVISLSYDGAKYALTSDGGTDTLSSTELVHSESYFNLGNCNIDGASNIQSLSDGTIDLNASTFSFWTWNGISNPTQQWTKFIGIQFATTKGTTVTKDWPSVFNKPTYIPIQQIDGTGVTTFKIEHVVVTNDINTLRTNTSIPNNTLILGYGGYV